MAPLVAGLLVLGGAGCASTAPQAPDASSAPAAPTETPSNWWSTAKPTTLQDTYQAAQATVSPGGDYSPEDASKASEPATIGTDGTISLSIHFVLGEVKRRVTEAYISKEVDGSLKGPALSCAPGASATTETFDCTSIFTDPTFSTGVYYGIIETEPGLESLQGYGNLEAIAPIYTKLPS
ncbi:hypothetical protein [Subtercola vilae]|uniref:hypothetical protein n=1 Tax=Subtercola vilae TaxID=2056433 RepID=UPI0010AA0DBB|nr:hypothetical protein [Subtercola vilae]